MGSEGEAIGNARGQAFSAKAGAKVRGNDEKWASLQLLFNLALSRTRLIRVRRERGLRRRGGEEEEEEEQGDEEREQEQEQEEEKKEADNEDEIDEEKNT